MSKPHVAYVQEARSVFVRLKFITFVKTESTLCVKLKYWPTTEAKKQKIEWQNGNPFVCMP